MPTEVAFFTHPYDHFNQRHLAAIPGTCFVLMPFKPEFTIVYETIERALQGLMQCSRADDMRIGNPILERILTGIRSAELIIADLSGLNPNVMYELGIAHMVTKNVLLLTQDLNGLPFDVAPVFFRRYSLNSNADIDSLAEAVRAAAAEVRSLGIPTMLKDRIARTKQLVQYMDQLNSVRERSHGPLVVRLHAAFSSFSNIGYPDSNDPEKREYGEWLEKERESLTSLITNGGKLYAIIHPAIRIRLGDSIPSWQARYDRLLDFVQTFKYIDRCEFAISPEQGPNLFFFGEDVLFEGHKTSVESGYGWTMVYTDAEYIRTRLTIFDTLFESAKQHTIKRFAANRGDLGEKTALRYAVISAIKAARAELFPPT
jgi:hypothetical protein